MNDFYFVEPYLTTRSLHPENQEAPIHFLNGEKILDRVFFRRNHFSYPSFSKENFFLQISGIIPRPLILTIDDLMKMPSKTIDVVLECAGNQRSKFNPNVYGEQWEEGAINQGQWRGIPLRTILSFTGLSNQAREIVFEGHDYGERKDTDKVVPYERSLPIKKALHPDTIIAFEYNCAPIPFKHGYPFRLIVPQWYAMASVKWLKRITIIGESFTGPFQAIDYIYFPDRNSPSNGFPVTSMNVNSIIQQPLHLSELKQGLQTIKGIAWTGEGSIVKVEVSFDLGKTWKEANIQRRSKHRYSWTEWNYDWIFSSTGEFTIQSRALDSKGRIQPPEALWNKKGYGYNEIPSIKVNVN